MDGKTQAQNNVRAYEMVHREEVGKDWESRIMMVDSIDHGDLVAEMIESEEMMRRFLR